MQRRVIAGGPDDFMTVHHLKVRGTQVEIGAALASEARDHFGWRPPPTGDPIRNSARRKWFERNWPEQHARMVGVAKAFDQDIDDDAFDFANVMAEPFTGSCSGVWCSSLLAADGHAQMCIRDRIWPAYGRGSALLHGTFPAGSGAGVPT